LDQYFLEPALKSSEKQQQYNKNQELVRLLCRLVSVMFLYFGRVEGIQKLLREMQVIPRKEVEEKQEDSDKTRDESPLRKISDE